MKKKNIPNYITIARIAASPLIAAFLWSGNFAVGIPLYIMTALTDFVDGKLARKWNAQSVEGKYLDTVADKIFATIMILTVTPIYPALWLNLGMEVAIGSVSYEASKKQHDTGSAMTGKIKTWALSMLLGGSIMAQYLPQVEQLIPLLFVTTMGYQLATLSCYVKQYKKEEKRLECHPEELLEPSEEEITDVMKQSDISMQFVNFKAVRALYRSHLYKDYVKNFSNQQTDKKEEPITIDLDQSHKMMVKKRQK